MLSSRAMQLPILPSVCMLTLLDRRRRAPLLQIPLLPLAKCLLHLLVVPILLLTPLQIDLFLLDDTISLHDALSGPDAASWRAADEFASLQANHTWTLVPLPPGRRPISCKWILRRKLHFHGTVARFKARLVAGGADLGTRLY